MGVSEHHLTQQVVIKMESRCGCHMRYFKCNIQEKKLAVSHICTRSIDRFMLNRFTYRIFNTVVTRVILGKYGVNFSGLIVILIG